MRVLHRFVTDPHPCAYLPDRMAKLEYSFASAMLPQDYEDLMNRGYRKFGAAFFRPVCDGCSECRPIRVEVDAFRPDRSQRRAWKRNQDLEVRFAPPSVDAQRLDLYRRYHESQSARKGWPHQQMSPEEYTISFVHNPIPSIEISFWDRGALRGVVLTDITPNVVSGIYHYHEPTEARRGIGNYCILHTIELARRLKRRWTYFGFYVSGCSSMAYKSTFRPCEYMSADGAWVPFRS